jgi:undecaprenyl-diphosphatase
MTIGHTQLELWQTVVLGLVEGITEYLPVSSTGHLILASALMKLNQTEAQEAAVRDFNIVIQGGAIAAVVGLYWPSVLRMLRGLIGRDEAGLRLLLNLAIAFAPSAVIGLALGDWIDAKLFHEWPVLFALAAGAVYMAIVSLKAQGRIGRLPQAGKGPDIWDVTPKQALLIGCLQCITLWPGMSRSMMTITGGIFAGLRPKKAAEFSFLLGLPTLLAATGYKLAKNLWKSHKEHTPNMFETLGFGACAVGIIVAAISAAVAVRWLVGFLNRHGLALFAWYRLALCAILGGMIMTGMVDIKPPPRPVIKNQTTTIPPIQWDSPAKEGPK